MAEFLEALMLVCFGLSWPINVWKNIKSRTARNMSLRFILLIIAGYIAGIIAKISRGNINYVLAVYVLNLFIVSVNVAVYFVNKNNDRKTSSAPVASPVNAVETAGAAVACEPHKAVC